MSISASLSDAFIFHLRRMSKIVENPRAREMPKARHLEKNYDVVSADREHRFRLITRQSTLISESFSCGLLWLPPSDAPVVLTRYNGSDHSHRNPLEGDAFESQCHIHLASERYIAASRKAEHYAAPTDRYSDMEGALHCLLTDWAITGLSTSRDSEQLGLI
ncbi:hypothetical protein CAL29_18040 [Bordetella genomosp. 10]|uniref:Uncharacterized protein n=1 Tax=Bordetella genomosp. 10 TaxID=1416804 RepID=A0A261S0D9_9BORD|nr:hypothetical protein [Bordetella genomosp. 10]OZI29983.1 hypothetical protein CAL29_18040 [Bordetella genomosp. 10]